MFCLSSEMYDSLKLKHSFKLETALRLRKAANQLPIETRGVVCLCVSLGGRKFEHNFHVLAKSEADCLIGLDFLEDHYCDPLFMKKNGERMMTLSSHCTTKFIQCKLIRSSELSPLTMFGSQQVFR